MKQLSLFFNLFLILLSLTAQSEDSIKPSDKMTQLAMLETNYNPAVQKTDKLLAIKHYEVPFKFIQKDLAENLNPNVINALTFTKDGELYFRWVIHPNDKSFHKKVKRFLKKNRLDSSPKTYLKGFLTSSRSLFILDPATGYEFGLKVSSNRSGGPFQSFKGQSYKNSLKNRSVNDMLVDGRESFVHKHFTFLEESAAFGINGISSGILIRSFDNMFSKGLTYIPVFSLFTNEYSSFLANSWGMKNNNELWNEVLYKPLGRAMAELEILYGIRLNSPHSQNFLLELDSQQRPTGRIVFRDIGDLRIHTKHLESIGYGHIPPQFNVTNKLSKDLPHIDVALKHGIGQSLKVEWLNEQTDKELNLNLITEFERRAAELLGLPPDSVIRTNPKRFIELEPISMTISSYANWTTPGGVVSSDTIWHSKNYPDLAKAWHSIRPNLRDSLSDSFDKTNFKIISCKEILN